MNFVKKIIKYALMLVALIFIAGTGKLIAAFLNDQLNTPSNKIDNIQKVIRETAEAVNQKTPITVDKDTRLDSVAALTRNLVYYYTITTSNKSDLDMNFVNNQFSNSVKNKACTTPELEIFFKNGASVSYVYNDKSGIRITDIKVTNEYCRTIDS